MRLRGLIFGIAAGLLAWSPADASGLQVAPVELHFSPGTAAEGLWLTNTGQEALHAQVRVFHWSQANGKDALTPTRALVASPPMLDLAPGARQLVRIIRAGGGAAAGEDAYRVLVNELPPAATRGKGIHYTLNYSIPVFTGATPSGNAAQVASRLSWSLARTATGTALEVRNDGDTHAQLSAVELQPPGAPVVVVTPGLLGYVLPGMTMRWPLPSSASHLPSGTQLMATINGTPVNIPSQAGGLSR